MKCLSIREPWLTLIMQGDKEHEFRTWNPRIHGLGLVALHSSKTYGRTEKYVTEVMLGSGYLKPHNVEVMKRWLGHVRGVVSVPDIIDLTAMRNKGLPLEIALDLGLPDDWRKKQTYAWRMVRERLLAKPIPLKGQLGLFDVDDDLITKAGVAHQWKV